MNVICVCLGGKFSVRHNFLPSKFFLSADQPRPESNFQITLSSQGQKVPNFPSPVGLAKVQNFLFSRLALPHVNFMWEFLHQHGARWPLPRVYKFPPSLQRLRWVSHGPPSPRMVKISRFMLPIWCPPFRVTPQLG